jgi:hypothetical protein
MTEPRLKIFTATVSYRGEDRLDISRGTGTGVGLLLAPSLALLRHVLDLRMRQLMSIRRWREFESRYAAEVAPHLDEVLAELAWHESATLCCHCREHHCHRVKAATLLAAASNGHALYEGERVSER